MDFASQMGIIFGAIIATLVFIVLPVYLVRKGMSKLSETTQGIISFLFFAAMVTALIVTKGC